MLQNIIAPEDERSRSARNLAVCVIALQAPFTPMGSPKRLDIEVLADLVIPQAGFTISLLMLLEGSCGEGVCHKVASDGQHPSSLEFSPWVGLVLLNNIGALHGPHAILPTCGIRKQ